MLCNTVRTDGRDDRGLGGVSVFTKFKQETDCQMTYLAVEFGLLGGDRSVERAEVGEPFETRSNR